MNYTGGKYKLLPQILPLFPKETGTFVDLFTGGGNIAVNIDAKRIIANDFEPNVIGIYKSFQNTFGNVDELISVIEKTISEYGLTIDNAEAFNRFRDDYNRYKTQGTDISDKLPYDISIMLYILICYSFNHQFRFNSRGEFNMPFGKDRSQWNDTMKKNLTNFHKAITEKEIIFTNKDNEKDGWNSQCERDLLNLLDTLDSKGIRFALSNVMFSKGKTNDILIKWSGKYNVHHLDYTYQNCNYHTKDKESKADEILVTNY